MKLQNAYDLFLLSVRGQLSGATEKWYTCRLSNMVKFLGDCEIEQVTVNDLRRWRVSLQERQTLYQSHPITKPVAGSLSVWTLHSYIRAARRFFRWSHEEGILTINPAVRLELPRLPKGKRQGVSLDDIEKMVDAATCERDKAVVLFFSSTACRLRGVVGLRLADLDLDNGRALVCEKGNQTRTVYLVPVAVESLRAWLAVRPAVQTDKVFVSQYGQGLTSSGVYQLLKRLARRAGVAGFNPHAFRHGAARLMQAQGMPTGVLSQILGHSDVSVTVAFYGVCDDSELKTAHSRYGFLTSLPSK
jgi:site-specific recombinase XerD